MGGLALQRPPMTKKMASLWLRTSTHTLLAKVAQLAVVVTAQQQLQAVQFAWQQVCLVPSWSVSWRKLRPRMTGGCEAAPWHRTGLLASFMWPGTEIHPL